MLCSGGIIGKNVVCSNLKNIKYLMNLCLVKEIFRYNVESISWMFLVVYDKILLKIDKLKKYLSIF